MSITRSLDQLNKEFSVDTKKLADIEDGATADQTAAEILTLIKTVDGAGSALDADLLDGQHGSYYLDWGNQTNKPTTLTGYGVTDELARKVFTTSGTASSANLYTKIASVNITQRYAEYTASLKVISKGYGNGNTRIATISLRVKQQEDFGSNPYIEMLFNYFDDNSGSATFGYTIIRNTPDTLVDIYCFMPSTYTTIVGWVSAESDKGNAQYFSNQSLSSSAPAGYVQGTENRFLKSNKSGTMHGALTIDSVDAQAGLVIGSTSDNIFNLIRLRSDSLGDNAYLVSYGSNGASPLELAMKNNATNGVLGFYAQGAKKLHIDSGGATVYGDMSITKGTSGDAILTIETDTDNNDEGDHPSIRLKQDGGLVDYRIGPGINDGDTGSYSNSLHLTSLAGTTDFRVSPDGTNSYGLLYDKGRNFSTVGYMKLSNGLILQWGLTNSYASNTTLGVTFPITFPSACLNVSMSTVRDSTNPNNVFLINYSTNVTASGFSAFTDSTDSSTGNIRAYWFALGF